MFQKFNQIQDPSGKTQSWFEANLIPVGKFAFWVGVIAFLLGQWITFFPGSERDWFLITSLFLFGGLLVPNAKLRLAVVLLVGICLAQAYDGYVRGIEYQRRHTSNCRQLEVQSSSYESMNGRAPALRPLSAEFSRAGGLAPCRSYMQCGNDGVPHSNEANKNLIFQ